MRTGTRWKNLTQRQYLYAIFVFSSLLLLTFSYTIYQQSSEIENRDRWVNHTYEVLRLNRRLYTSALNIETGQRGYLLSGTDSFLGPYKTALAGIGPELAAIQKATLDNPGHQRAFVEFEKKLKNFTVLMDQQIQTYRKRGISGLSKGDLNNARASMDELRTILDNVASKELQLLDERLVLGRHEQKKYFVLLVGGSMLALLGLFLSNFVIFAMLTRVRGTEARLHSFEERLGLVLEGVNDGIYDFNPETRIMEFSPAYKSLLGYEPSELNGPVERFLELIHPDDLEAFRSCVASYMEGKTPALSHVFRLRHNSGNWKWILSRGIAVWDGTGQPKRLVGTHTDITEQKAREEELKQMNLDLESFAYIASHDLRSPLVNLKGFAGEIAYALNEAKPVLDVALSHLPEEARAATQKHLEGDIPEAIGFIRAAVEKMDVLTTAILDMSRIGKRIYTSQEVSLNVLVQRCLDTLAYEINQNHITVTVSDLPILQNDPVALEQIFGNILDNSIKYLRPNVPGMIRIDAVNLGHGYEFHIQDNGRGISQNDYAKVFDIFRRAGNVGDVRGAGMGMSYVKALVRKVGGRIWFTSVVNEGTTFSVFLPNRIQNSNFAT